MSTGRIKEKISQIVGSQLPEFIRVDYTTFVSFIEAYYRFLEQDGYALEIVQNADSYADIDRTTEPFVNYFLKNYAEGIPYSSLLNKKFLIKRINDLYQAKGSQLSFKLLFKLLYNVYLEVNKPYDTVLKASDGRWQQNISLRVEKTSGSADDLVDRFLTLKKNGITYKDAIIRVKNLEPNLYEVFLKSTSRTPFESGDEVYLEDSTGIVFVGEIKPTATSYSITNSGSGFKPGSIFTVSVAGGIDTLMRIVEVDSNGGIKVLKFLNYGYGFPNSNITFVLNNDLSVSSKVQNIINRTGGFKETITFTEQHTLLSPSRYFDTDYTSIDYTGTPLLTASFDNTFAPVDIANTDDPSTATITFYMGAIARYPGQYISSQGFISEPEVRLQDGGLYQPFAYQLESELDISLFYDTVKKLIHPAGTGMYNNRTLTATANIKSFIDVETSRNTLNKVFSTFTVADSTTKNFGKVLIDTAPQITESTVKGIYKALDHSANVTDTTIKSITKLLDDVQDQFVEETVFSTAKVLEDTISLTDNILVQKLYFRTFDDNVLQSDSLFVNTSLPEIDDVSLDDAVAFNSGKFLTDDTGSLDSLIKTISILVDDSTVVVDSTSKSVSKLINNVSNVTFIESVTRLTANYAEPGYFDEIYAGETFTLL